MTSKQVEKTAYKEPIDRVKKELTKSFSVSASAGCGKTHILISRVLALLEKGIDLEKLLLLTFTENAAREMRIRLLRELNKIQDCEWKSKAIEQLPTCSIQTINSFALSIVTSNFLNLSLSSEPKVLDDIAAQKGFDRAFNSCYDNWANNDIHSNFFATSQAIEITRVNMKEMAHKVELLTPFHSVEDFDFNALNLELERSIRNLEAICRPNLNRLNIVFEEIDRSKIKKEPLNRLEAINNFALNCLKTESPLDFFQDFAHHKKFITDNRLSTKTRSEIEIFEECFDVIREQIEVYLVEVKNFILTYCSNLLVEFVQHFRNSRFARGEITHDESLSLANIALRDEPTRYDVWKKYASILVDEFQDTDDIQIEILQALSEKDEEFNVGRLFIVGDAKQSIYGFRGAKVKSYQEFIAQADIEDLHLDKSYRTLDSVLHPINEIAKVLIQDYREMSTNRSSGHKKGEPNSHVKLLGQPIDGQIDAIRKIQSKDIALSMAELIGKEIGKEGQRRQSTFGDITLLLRNSTGINELLNGLNEHKIPHTVDSVDLIWDLTFTKMTLAIISAIADPDDYISIVGVLKSPVFGCTNDELIEWVKYTKEKNIDSTLIWNYETLPKYSSDLKVGRSLAKLRELNIENKSKFTSEILTRLHSNSGMIESFEHQGEQVGESISRYLIELALHFEENNSERSLLSFLEYVEAVKKTNKSPVKFRSKQSSNAVKIMTIHKSKGLEFPIVYVVPSINHKSTSDRYAFKSDFENNQYVAPLLYFRKDLKHSGIEDLIELKTMEKMEEEARLLYVAMTRAEDYLVLCTHEKKSEKKKIERANGGVALLNYALQESGIADHLEPFNFQDSNETLKEITGNKKDSRHIKVLDNSKIYKLNDSFAQSEIITPSSLDEETNLESEISELPLKMQITKPWKSNLIGTATHRVLQVIPFDADNEIIESVSRSCANRYDIPELSKEIANHVKKALSHRIIKNAKVAFREVPVNGYKDGKLIEGFIDLLVKDNDGWAIIDYKTDAISKTFTIDSKIEKYKNQLRTYKYLLENEHGYKINTIALMFLNTPDDGFVKIP